MVTVLKKQEKEVVQIKKVNGEVYTKLDKNNLEKIDKDTGYFGKKVGN
jgi:hypothetical protein